MTNKGVLLCGSQHHGFKTRTFHMGKRCSKSISIQKTWPMRVDMSCFKVNGRLSVLPIHPWKKRMDIRTIALLVQNWNDLDFSSKGKCTDTNYNVIAHERNPSHYQLLDDIIVIHRRITSYKVLQHLLTHVLHHNLAETHASSSELL
jgi:hypothetical protein